MSMPPEELDELRAMRETAMPGETTLIWAVQDGDDTTTRQALPGWVAKPIEKFALNWGDECKKWKELSLSRSRQGKGFTPLQQKNHDDFAQNRSVCKLLYNKDTKSHVSNLRSNADLKSISKNHFSLTVRALNDGAIFEVQAATGEPKKLMLLQGDPVPLEDGEIPADLDSGVAAEIAAAAAEGNLQDLHERHEEQEGEELGAEFIDALEEEKQLEEEKILEEVCCNTSDEEEVSKLFPSEGFVKVKAFCYRDEYKKLQGQGLTMIPNHMQGIFLSFHKGTRTWQGFYPGVSTGLCYTFGGSTKRAWVPFYGLSIYVILYYCYYYSMFVSLIKSFRVWQWVILSCFCGEVSLLSA